MSLRILFFLLCSQLAYANSNTTPNTAETAQGEAGIDDILAAESTADSPLSTDSDGKVGKQIGSQLILNESDILRSYWGDNIHHNSLLYMAFTRAGTPYVWGGYSWLKGIDCSHFTMRLFQDLGAYYTKYQTTYNLKSVRVSNGYYRVPLSAAKFGDMLVYGRENTETKEWAGHVVILLDPDFKQDNFKGLVVGAHGSDVGVRFISYKGFPHYYRLPEVKLHNVLRVNNFAERDACILGDCQ